MKHPTQGPGWKPGDRIAKKKMPFNGVLYTMAEISGLFDDDFLDMYTAWKRWKKFGFHYAGGQEDQTALYIDILETIEGVFDHGRDGSS